MARLVFEHVNKNYNKVNALKDFSLEIKDHELLVILGTSGSGKSTLLRIISGLENIYSGDIYLDDVLLRDIDIKERKVGMVFQSYALYPQMSAYENLTLPLKQDVFYKPLMKKGKQVYGIDYDVIDSVKEEIRDLEKNDKYKENKIALKKKIKDLKKNPTIPLYSYQRISNEEIEERLNKVKGLLDLNSFLTQRVSTLSGGQKQRVALAKALVKEPDILLLDEPMSNLDTKLRANSRELIKRLHDRVKTTTILVSHDQNDAYALADRVVILDEGEIKQVGTIDEIYNHPNNLIAAKFLGNPSLNVIPCIYDGKKLKVNTETEIYIPLSNKKKKLLKDYINKEILVGIRPEDISLNKDGGFLNTNYERSELYGRDILHHVFIDEIEILIKTKEKLKVKDKETKLFFVDEKILMFDKSNGTAIR